MIYDCVNFRQCVALSLNSSLKKSVVSDVGTVSYTPTVQPPLVASSPSKTAKPAIPAIGNMADDATRAEVHGWRPECPTMSAMHHLSPDRVVVALRCTWAWLMNTGYRPEQHYMRGKRPMSATKWPRAGG